MFEESGDLVKTAQSMFDLFKVLYSQSNYGMSSVRSDSRGYYNAAHSEFYKKIYLEVKSFFDEYQDRLSPTDKLVVLEEYIRLWEDVDGRLDIQDTDYSEQYKDVLFSKYRGGYNAGMPMVAGFNLKNIDFRGREFFKPDMIFPSVNLTGADFTNACLPYASFYDCNFTDSKAVQTNFNQSFFERCDLTRADFSTAQLCEGTFHTCLISGTQYNKTTAHSSYGHRLVHCFKDNMLAASSNGNLELVRQQAHFLPASIHSCDGNGNTPLHVAVMNEQIEVIDLLLKNGAQMDAVNKFGLTPFGIAWMRVPSRQGKYSLEAFDKMIKLFLNAGFDLNGTAHRSKSYLGNLAAAGALDACKILVKHGADINIQDKFGYTPLHYVSSSYKKNLREKEQAEVAKWLVNIGADKNIKTKEGMTALDLAKEFEHRDIIESLSPYPLFLQRMKVKTKNISAKRVAHALWLSDKDWETTEKSKAEFAQWADSYGVSFNLSEVNAVLSAKYQMKSPNTSVNTLPLVASDSPTITVPSKVVVPQKRQSPYIRLIQREFEQFKLNAAKTSSGTVSGKPLYELTKAFFDIYQDLLSPEEKAVVLEAYITLWEETSCQLDISETEYSAKYDYSRFGPYPGQTPMLAGFNLKHIAFHAFNKARLLFIDVNFRNADFVDASFDNCIFYCCDFFDSIYSTQSVFERCLFKHCNFQNVYLSNAQLRDTELEQCITYKTNFHNVALHVFMSLPEPQSLVRLRGQYILLDQAKPLLVNGKYRGNTYIRELYSVDQKGNLVTVAIRDFAELINKLRAIDGYLPDMVQLTEEQCNTIISLNGGHTHHFKSQDYRLTHCFDKSMLAASRDGDIEAVRQLADFFPESIHSSNDMGNTPLHLATLKGQVKVVAFLLAHGARIGDANNIECVPFEMALEFVSEHLQKEGTLSIFEEIVKLYVDAGYDLNVFRKNHTHLGYLARRGDLEPIKILIAHGAKIDIQNQWGETPLHGASGGPERSFYDKERELVAEWLVNHGADKNIKTQDGETALDLAKQFKHQGIVELLTPRPPYPLFLQKLKVKIKNISAERVAHALWLSDKNWETTEQFKKEFALWADDYGLEFNLDEVNAELLRTYEMKSRHTVVDNSSIVVLDADSFDNKGISERRVNAASFFAATSTDSQPAKHSSHQVFRP